jgi:hypothetical protein
MFPPHLLFLAVRLDKKELSMAAIILSFLVNRLLRKIIQEEKELQKVTPGHDARLLLYRANVANFTNTYHAVMGKEIKIKKHLWN